MARRALAASKQSSKRRRWSQEVTERSNALDLEPKVFTLSSPVAIAESLKRSAEASDRRKTSPHQSAMSMLNFYINRAGTNLTPGRKRILERAKGELRRLFGRAGVRRNFSSCAAPPTERDRREIFRTRSKRLAARHPRAEPGHEG